MSYADHLTNHSDHECYLFEIRREETRKTEKRGTMDEKIVDKKKQKRLIKLK